MLKAYSATASFWKINSTNRGPASIISAEVPVACKDTLERAPSSP
jgi:hypothetical protein